MYERDQMREKLLLNDKFITWVLHPTPALDQYWLEWQNESPEREAILSEARQLVQQMKAVEPQEVLPEREVQQMWQVLQARHGANQKAKSTHRIIDWYWVAASVVVLLTSSVFLYLRINEPALITHQTTYGETRYVTLPDSSSVYLNSNSSITYQEAWLESSERKLTLSGEAFFKVHHTKDHRPFLVHANAVTVKVLGTSFNVLNRRDRTQIVLQEGEVALQTKEAEVLPNDIIMQPGELVEIEAGDYIQHPVNVQKYTAWIQNEHIFDGTTIAEIAQLLEDTYGLNVSIENNSTADKKFTGRINRGNLTSLFGQMEKVFQIKIEQHQDRVTIR
ncbi:FecR family protein [Tunicatimonas pelagia]|uniref:FecR family protein n=1 Tax=Tunicatimonas pelagia TaxID=931531 RepID=UPI002665D993|nr:FecR domain-containing protein [Tunicatimonas pelagia]WKN44664.1 FecR domain-containing protein [Tunicatimonas pelagia]